MATTAIDLSRLPAPTFADTLDYESIFAAMAAAVVEILPTFDATDETDPAVIVLQAMAYREMHWRQSVNESALSVLLAYAAGAMLDQIGAMLGVARLVLDPGDAATGIDATYESDDDFRARIQLAPEGLSVAGPASAYEYHARSVSAQVLDARATSPAPGEVLVSVLSRVGDGSASPDLLATVTDALSADGVRPMTDAVSVVSAELVDFNIVARLVLDDGPDETVVLANAQASLNLYIEKQRRLGRDINTKILAASLAVAGVSNILLDEPAMDIVIAPTQCAHCVGIAVSVVGRGE